MKKSDLEYGNVVEVRNGDKYLLHSDDFISLTGNGYLPFNNYRQDFTDIDGDVEFDIMKVYKDYTCTDLLWERKDEPKPKLTEDEKVILRNLPKEYKWIARDGFGFICIFENKPDKAIFGCFYSAATVLPFPKLFKFIKYEDKEPYSIEKLLKGEK